MTDNIYYLLEGIDQNSPSQGLTAQGLVIDDPRFMQSLTTVYITSMYYSVMANLHLQSVLPDDIDEAPRLKVAFERSYADYAAASKWLEENGSEFISTSTARWYYEEVAQMGSDRILDVTGFLAQKNLIG